MRAAERWFWGPSSQEPPLTTLGYSAVGTTIGFTRFLAGAVVGGGAN